jgi:hypothetical protein
VWGGESRIGVSISYLDTHPDGLSIKDFHLIHRYNLQEFDANGDEIILVVKPKMEISEYQLVKSYYINKIQSFFGPDKSMEFLAQVLSVEAVMRPSTLQKIR